MLGGSHVIMSAENRKFLFLECPWHMRETDANSQPPLLPRFFVTDTKGIRIKYSIYLVRSIQNQEGKLRIVAGNRFSVELIVFE